MHSQPAPPRPATNRPRLGSLPLPTSLPEKIQQPIRIAVDFAGPKVKPIAFVWSGRKYIVKRVNMVYKRPHGNRFDWCFAVSDDANSFILVYDPTDMRWILEEVYAL